MPLTPGQSAEKIVRLSTAFPRRPGSGALSFAFDVGALGDPGRRGETLIGN